MSAQDRLTKEAFAEFCESKPADETYDYWSVRECACGQYSRFIGDTSWKNYGVDKAADRVWDQFNREAQQVRPSTFGALAARLRASR
jgi:hypothetical protein